MSVAVAALVAIGFCITIWSVASNNAKEQIEAGGYAENHAEVAGNRIKSDCAERQGTALYECAKEIVEPSREQQRSEYDLAAQRGMERWAFWMLAATLGSVVITGIGVVYVALTLREARETTAAAIKSADAAEKAVEETRRMGEAQLRAYLTASKFELKIDERSLVSARFDYRNTGQSPAFGVRIEMHVGFILPSESQPVPAVTGMAFIDDIAAGEQVEGRIVSAQLPEPWLTIRKESRIIPAITVRFTWTDVFNRPNEIVFEYWCPNRKIDEGDFVRLSRPPFGRPQQ